MTPFYLTLKEFIEQFQDEAYVSKTIYPLERLDICVIQHENLKNQKDKRKKNIS